MSGRKLYKVGEQTFQYFQQAKMFAYHSHIPVIQTLHCTVYETRLLYIYSRDDSGKFAKWYKRYV